MEKKEYQSPKMEIVEMATLGNLLSCSGSDAYDCDDPVDVESED